MSDSRAGSGMFVGRGGRVVNFLTAFMRMVSLSDVMSLSSLINCAFRSQFESGMLALSRIVSK
jgi:hypothetical protein